MPLEYNFGTMMIIHPDELDKLEQAMDGSGLDKLEQAIDGSGLDEPTKNLLIQSLGSGLTF